MDDVLDFNEEIKKIKTKAELQRYCNAQYAALQTAQEYIIKLEDEIKHLKELLDSSIPRLNNVQQLIVSDEQAICELQIQKLRKTAVDRELTLEETKRLDLLVKNLYLAKGKATTISADSFKIDSIQEAELVAIAALPEPKNHTETE